MTGERSMRGRRGTRGGPPTLRPMQQTRSMRSTRGLRARVARPARLMALLSLFLVAAAYRAPAQSNVDADAEPRLRRFGHDIAFGTLLGFAYAGVDQLRNDPPEWGKGWPGYGRRLASDVGEFVIQESVTDGIAAMMNRPLDYEPSHSRDWSRRISRALQGAVTDQMPDGTHPIAVPRIVGAYAGSFAQASWRPAPAGGRTRTALINGTVSLIIGAGINLYREWRAR